jgi:hypothetical protein
MSALPIPCMFAGGHFIPLASHKRYASETFGEGEVVTLSPIEDRSAASHGHFFALLHQAWINLPEEYAERFPSEEHLRKWCLIKSGHRDERTTVCGSKAEAERVAAFIRPIDDYAIVVAREATVTVWTAKSQSMRAMGKDAFQQSKDDVLRVLSELIGTDVTTLHNAA